MSARFDPTGQNIAACSADRSICACTLLPPPCARPDVRTALWRTYPPNTNYALLAHLHKAPILDVHWSLSSPLLYTASADHTLGLTDSSTGQRVRRLRAHRGVVNALDRTLAAGAGVELVASASDDGFVKIWEGGAEGPREPVATLALGCPVTAVAFSADGTQIFAGALDNEIHVGPSVYPTPGVLR
jgi:Prp8 binding protein